MSEDTPEEWRPVFGYEGLYEVSDLGRVRSLPREVDNSGLGPGRKYTYPGKTLKPSRMKIGYQSVTLSYKGQKKPSYVHRLVCEAFQGPPRDGKTQVCHYDGDRHNNSNSNLRWDSPKGNMQDAKRHGTTRHPKRLDTHCGAGHRYTSETTSTAHDGTRRCKPCEARTARDRSKRGGLPTDTDPRHGTSNGYTNWGCRCSPCKRAGSEHNKQMKEQRSRDND